MVSRKNILLVDDEVNLCRIIGAKLAKSGYSVTAVHDGAQAIEQVGASCFDLVILDLVLPTVDGLTAIAEIRRITGNIPVIVMTACDNQEVVERVKQYNIAAYVTKPFDLDWFLSLVEKTTSRNNSLSGGNLPDSSILFCRGQRITLEFLNGRPSRCLDGTVSAKDERSVTVIVPNTAEFRSIAVPGTYVRVGLALHGAFYTFTSRILSAPENYPSKLVLEKPGFIYRVQRRQHERLALRMPVKCVLVGEGIEGDATTVTEGETRNVSLGGVCIAVGESLEPGSVVRLQIGLGNGEDYVEALAKVLRSTPCKQSQNGTWLSGCQFVDVDPSLGDLLGKQTPELILS